MDLTVGRPTPKRPRPPTNEQPEFMQAVRVNDVEAVAMFFEEGYRVLAAGLMLAVRKGRFEIAKVRPSVGVRGSERGNGSVGPVAPVGRSLTLPDSSTASSPQLMFEKGEARQYSLQRVTNPDYNEDYRGASLLHFAVLNDQPEMLKLLNEEMKE